jgi:class 3 adenylate cyclase/pimeloyl-ACP methyl ester carboxylesterase
MPARRHGRGRAGPARLFASCGGAPHNDERRPIGGDARALIMTHRPETKYARSGRLHIAYQVVGEGPFDLVLVPGFVSHVEEAWQTPSLARFLSSLAGFSRLILFDKPGTGLSDPLMGAPPLDERMDHVRAVMDAAGSERAALFGISEGGPMSILFAATYPERVTALVLFGTMARFLRDEDYPEGTTARVLGTIVQQIEDGWGDGALLDLFAPSIADDPKARHWWGEFQRRAASPGMARALIEMLAEIDVRPILPSIHTPTMILHRAGERAVPVLAARYLAAHIPGARYVEQPGIDHFPWLGDADALVDEIEVFLTGSRQTREIDRVLATVLFTDIVGSTEHAARLGDRGWRDLLEAHHAAIRRELARMRGREIATAGDGFLATFDGPARAIRCACAIQDAVKPLGLSLRAGLHTGECEIIGDDVGGIAVHIGARVAALAEPREVLVSGTVKDLVAGSGLRFTERGTHSLKGVPGEWRLYGVDVSSSANSR